MKTNDADLFGCRTRQCWVPLLLQQLPPELEPTIQEAKTLLDRSRTACAG